MKKLIAVRISDINSLVVIQETAIIKRRFELQEANAKAPCFSYETPIPND
jgi:hypothetical protein